MIGTVYSVALFSSSENSLDFESTSSCSEVSSILEINLRLKYFFKNLVHTLQVSKSLQPQDRLIRLYRLRKPKLSNDNLKVNEKILNLGQASGKFQESGTR